jgi:hypothetical protein
MIPSAQVSSLTTGSITLPSAKSAFVEPASFESIATVTMGAGGGSSASFTSIPSTYSHLQIRFIATTNDSNYNAALIRFNSDSGSNYAWRAMYGAQTGVGAEGAYPDTAIRTISIGGTTQGSAFTVSIVNILDYKSTSKNKSSRWITGQDSNGAGYGQQGSGLWMNNTTAITSITITPITGGAVFREYSSFALYGIKGA